MLCHWLRHTLSVILGLQFFVHSLPENSIDEFPIRSVARLRLEVVKDFRIKRHMDNDHLLWDDFAVYT